MKTGEVIKLEVYSCMLQFIIYQVIKGEKGGKREKEEEVRDEGKEQICQCVSEPLDTNTIPHKHQQLLIKNTKEVVFYP